MSVKENLGKLKISAMDAANPITATARRRQASIQVGRVVTAVYGGVLLGQAMVRTGGLPPEAASDAVIRLVGPAAIETIYNEIVKGARKDMPGGTIKG